MRALFLCTFLISATSFLHAENGISTQMAAPATMALMKEKLKLITLDRVDFDNADIATVAKTLTQLTKAASPDSNITITSEAPATPKIAITIHVQATSLADVLALVSTMSGLDCSLGDNKVTFKPAK